MPTTRTNLELDDDLIERAMAMFGTTTKRETVELALRRLVEEPSTTAQALEMRGTGWDGDLELLRGEAP